MSLCAKHSRFTKLHPDGICFSCNLSNTSLYEVLLLCHITPTTASWLVLLQLQTKQKASWYPRSLEKLNLSFLVQGLGKDTKWVKKFQPGKAVTGLGQRPVHPGWTRAKKSYCFSHKGLRACEKLGMRFTWTEDSSFSHHTRSDLSLVRRGKINSWRTTSPEAKTPLQSPSDCWMLGGYYQGRDHSCLS